MSLNWDVSKVADEVRLVDGEMNPVTHALIFLTMSTGIGTITEANAGEFFARTVQAERIFGSMVSFVDKKGHPQDRPITLTDVIAHIGLKTNASFTDEPRAKWLKRMLGQEMDGDVRSLKQAQAAAKAVAAPVLTTT